MPSDRPERPMPRRSWPQRLLIALGGLLAVALLAAAAGLGWGIWKFNQIDRADVDLSETPAGAPQNYLLVGSDSRAAGDPIDPGSKGDELGRRSDTIMVLRIDPAQESAVMLSLPRDLWVPIAGTDQHQRINAAYGKGEQTLIDTIEQYLGIPINHYVEVDFKGFQAAVDAVGGIPLYFDRAMRDRNSGLDVLHPGCVTLDGYQALGFARARHLEYMLDGVWRYDGTGDLGRISRQQLFLRKTIDKAVAKGLGNPLTLRRLVEAGTKSVTLDKGISAQDLLALGERFQHFDGDGLKTLTVPATPFTTDGGAQVLRLDEAAAQPLLNVFRGKALDDVTEGSVSVTVLGSEAKADRAPEVAAALKAAGFQIAHWGNGSELDHPVEEHTLIRYGTGGQAAAQLVARHLTVDADVAEDPDLTPGQVVVFVGADFTTVQARRRSLASMPRHDRKKAKTRPVGTRRSSSAGGGGKASTRRAGSGPSTTVVGRVPGEAPPGESCG